MTVRIDTSDRRPISPFIYGLNFAEAESVWGKNVPRGITLSRFGGNRLTAYNWQTNASNCGNDCNGAFPNDDYLGGGDRPGEAVRFRAAWAFDHDAAFLATVPMLGWVAGDKAGPVSLELPAAERLAQRFRASRARKGRPFSDARDLTEPTVYQDEFVAWLERIFPFARSNPRRTIFYGLDNEPDLWGFTHEEVRGRGAHKQPTLTGYEELVQLSSEYASAVKEAAPGALVFGPVLSNWNGFANLYHNSVPDPAGGRFFLEYYLDAMRHAEVLRGRRLLDVLDVHWYAEAMSAHHQSVSNEWAPQDPAMVEARVQSPRSLWDPSYREQSWVAAAAGGPLRLVPRLREMISLHYPGTRIAITEYSYHRGGDISGAVAQADALGIFGREGVFAAALWPLSSPWAYEGDLDRAYACTFDAFRMFRDYDGRGGAFGDVALGATTSDLERTSIYASSDLAAPPRLVLVALNKSQAPVDARVVLTSAFPYARAEVWQLTGEVGRCSGPTRATGADAVVSRGEFTVRLPALSVSTLVVGP